MKGNRYGVPRFPVGNIKLKVYVAIGLLFGTCGMWSGYLIVSVADYPKEILILVTLFLVGIAISLVKFKHKLLKLVFWLFLVGIIVCLWMPSQVFSVSFENLTDKNLNIFCTDIQSLKTRRFPILPGEKLYVVLCRGEREQFKEKVIIALVMDTEGNIYHQETIKVADLEIGKLISVEDHNILLPAKF